MERYFVAQSVISLRRPNSRCLLCQENIQKNTGDIQETIRCFPWGKGTVCDEKDKMEHKIEHKLIIRQSRKIQWKISCFPREVCWVLLMSTSVVDAGRKNHIPHDDPCIFYEMTLRQNVERVLEPKESQRLTVPHFMQELWVCIYLLSEKRDSYLISYPMPLSYSTFSSTSLLYKERTFVPSNKQLCPVHQK